MHSFTLPHLPLTVVQMPILRCTLVFALRDLVLLIAGEPEPPHSGKAEAAL
jgi:hypothetical protein